MKNFINYKTMKTFKLFALLFVIIMTYQKLSAQTYSTDFDGNTGSTMTISPSSGSNGSIVAPSTSTIVNHNYVTPAQTKTTTTSSSSPSVSTMVGGMIMQSMINNLFSSPKPDPAADAAAAAAAAKAAADAAAAKAEQQRIQDAIELAKYNKLMDSYKSLPGTQSMGFKGLPTSNSTKMSAEDSIILSEQILLDLLDSAWMALEKKLIQDRLTDSCYTCEKINKSLASKVPPLPSRFDALRPGDVLLIAPTNWSDDKSEWFQGKAVALGDRLATGPTTSDASHTVTYLKEKDGVKLYLDNMPGEGPTIITEDEVIKRYSQRKTDVARLSTWGVAEPLRPAQAEKLYQKAIELQSANTDAGKTNYGVWGENDIVCSEASWQLLKATGKKVPNAGTDIKNSAVDFSPADFYNQWQYFVVTPIEFLPK